MTELSEKILQSYQVRKTKKQKTAFIELLRTYYPELQVEAGGTFNPRNIVIGDVEKAKVVFAAHYDTCAVLPFSNFITPLNVPLYLLWNLLIAMPVVGLMFLAQYFGTRWSGSFSIGYLAMWAVFVPFIWLMLGGRPNQHTANDNTSGVITLCETLEAMTPEQRAKAAFVFFDLEEAGMFGSSRFAQVHKKQMKEKLLINFDCVSDGEYFLAVYGKKAEKPYLDVLKKAFIAPEKGETLLVKSTKAIYPSDQMQFPCGVGVASLKKKRGLGLYMDRIHTKHDTVFEENNIVYCTACACRLTGLL